LKKHFLDSDKLNFTILIFIESGVSLDKHA